MSELRNRIEGHVRALVAELEALVRAEALEVINGALAGSGMSSGRTPGQLGARAAKVRSGARANGSSRQRTAAGRRAPEQMKRDMEALVAYVRTHPGAKMEEVATAVRSTSQRLNRPMHKLVATGALTRKGQRRGSRYWVSGR